MANGSLVPLSKLLGVYDSKGGWPPEPHQPRENSPALLGRVNLYLGNSTFPGVGVGMSPTYLMPVVEPSWAPHFAALLCYAAAQAKSNALIPPRDT